MRTSALCLAFVLSLSGCSGLFPGSSRGSQGTYGGQRSASDYERERWEREQYERDRYARERYERDRYERDRYERDRNRGNWGHDHDARPGRDARYERGNAPRRVGDSSDNTVHVVGHGSPGQGSAVPVGGRAPVHVTPSRAPVHVSPGAAPAPARVVVQPAPAPSAPATSPRDNYVRPRTPVVRPSSNADRAGQAGGSGAQDKNRGFDKRLRGGSVRPQQ